MISGLVLYLEALWATLRDEHPELPAAVVVVASGEEGAKIPKLGHWGDSRWTLREDGSKVGEVLIAGEALEEGADSVLHVLLHESAHALASAREIKDTSRQGRYHNQKYRDIAQEIGLHVEQCKTYGWTVTSLTDELRSTWASAIQGLTSRLVAYRPSRLSVRATEAQVKAEGEGEGEGSEDGEERKPSRSLLICDCAEPRRIRVSPSVAALGPILCGLCGAEFHPEQGEESWDSPEEA
jgi:hypothetical protein